MRGEGRRGASVSVSGELRLKGGRREMRDGLGERGGYEVQECETSEGAVCWSLEVEKGRREIWRNELEGNEN